MAGVEELKPEVYVGIVEVLAAAAAVVVVVVSKQFEIVVDEFGGIVVVLEVAGAMPFDLYLNSRLHSSWSN